MAKRNRRTKTPRRRKLIKLPEVKEITGMGRSMIYKLKDLGLFPDSVTIGSRAVFWYLDEVLHYINTRPRSRSRRRQR